MPESAARRRSENAAAERRKAPPRPLLPRQPVRLLHAQLFAVAGRRAGFLHSAGPRQEGGPPLRRSESGADQGRPCCRIVQLARSDARERRIRRADLMETRRMLADRIAPIVVMAGLDPAIHDFLLAEARRGCPA